MTGYGSGNASAKGMSVVAEVSSVNRRQLDIRVSLPKPLAVLEARVFEEVRKKVSRGAVNISFNLTMSDAVRARSVHIDRILSAAYLGELRDAARDLKLEGPLDASILFQLPDVVKKDFGAPDPDRIWIVIRQALKDALGAMLEMRASEGDALFQDLHKRSELLRRYHGRITRMAPGVVSDHRRALRQRIQESGVEIETKDPSFLRELAIYADRCDISEELTRLESHFDQFGELMGSTDPAGRALDFLVQELFREINTIGSKASNAKISRHVIEFKSELERIREQVQNVE
jgi:uncharacterized protein (TIGR00255 family)